MEDLKGRVVLVTGGGRGLGEAVCQTLSSAGASVIVADIRQELAEKVAGESWFIGDILNDVEAGRRAGCKTILIDNGNETEWQMSPARSPHYTVADLAEAAQVITSS